jgi:hypothetical protein
MEEMTAKTENYALDLEIPLLRVLVSGEIVWSLNGEKPDAMGS